MNTLPANIVLVLIRAGMSLAELQAKAIETQNEQKRHHERKPSSGVNVNPSGGASNAMTTSRAAPSFRSKVRQDSSPVQVRLPLKNPRIEN